LDAFTKALRRAARLTCGVLSGPRREQNLSANSATDSEVLVRSPIARQSGMNNPMSTAKFLFPSRRNIYTKCRADDIRCFTHVRFGPEMSDSIS
jgi:hypothetical protein